MRELLAALALLVAPAAAHAACTPVPPAPGAMRQLPIWGGIVPSDGVLDVWCKVQAALHGPSQVDVWFPTIVEDRGPITHASFPTTFDGSPSQGKEVLAEFVQSLLPTGPSQAHDAQGAAFPLVLEKVLRPTAARTLDVEGLPLGFPPKFGAEDKLILWAPVALRVKPVVIDEIAYTLTVSFRPTLARWLEETEGLRETFDLYGAKDHILPDFDPTSCPDRLPGCGDYKGGKYADKPYLPVQTAWTLLAVKLEARGHALSAKTVRLFRAMAPTYLQWTTVNTIAENKFDAAKGEAKLHAEDGPRAFEITADGDPMGVAGTNHIVMTWTENPNAKDSYAAGMADWAEKTRQEVLMRYSAAHAHQ